MKRNILNVFFAVLLTACSTSVSDKIQDLNGYWEIDKVELPSGETKEYKMNSTIDFIELNSDTTGIRLKLQPLIDGGFLTSGDKEEFSIRKVNDQVIIKYHTGLDKWEEKLIKLNKDHFISLNDANLKYFYKRYQPVGSVADSINR